MTAMNAFARADGAWLLSDTAQYDNAGHVIGKGLKVTADERLNLAIGQSGRLAEGSSRDVCTWLATQPNQTQALANIASLVDLLDHRDREAVVHGALIDNPVPKGFRLTLAFWDRRDSRAKCAIIGSNAAMACGSQPRTLRAFKTLFSPPMSPDRWPGHSFNPSTDAAILAKYQRAVTDDRGIYRVGGTFQATRIHSNGIEFRDIHHWPDVVGKKVAL